MIVISEDTDRFIWKDMGKYVKGRLTRFDNRAKQVHV